MAGDWRRKKEGRVGWVKLRFGDVILLDEFNGKVALPFGELTREVPSEIDPGSTGIPSIRSDCTFSAPGRSALTIGVLTLAMHRISPLLADFGQGRH